MKYILTDAFNAPYLEMLYRDKEKVLHRFRLDVGEGNMPANVFNMFKKSEHLKASVKDGLLRFPDDEDLEAIFGKDAEKRRRELYARIGETPPEDAKAAGQVSTAIDDLIKDSQSKDDIIAEQADLIATQSETLEAQKTAMATLEERLTAIETQNASAG